MGFMKMLNNVLNNRIAYTENGAAGYETTGNALLDLNFAAASLRNADEQDIVKHFVKAYYEDRMLALKWLFFARDIRGGLGERRLFRIIMHNLAVGEARLAEELVELLAEYGRWDDVLCLMNTPAEERTLEYIANQLSEDMENMEQGRPVSLCAKWMPGNNTSSVESRDFAGRIQGHMQLTSKEYRKMLSALRAYLEVTEVYMSENAWEKINYAHVASKSNLVYRNAFIRHDKERREVYLQAVQDNGAVLHAGTLMPHEIVAKYTQTEGWRMQIKEVDITLEELWKNLNNTIKRQNILCVVDGSGSMLCKIGSGTSGTTTALHVSNALGIYFAEHMKGAYRNKFITFSSKPEYVDLSGCGSLREKLELAFAHDDCSNTNIEATFDLILETALENNLRQEELPKMVLVISDMEFDSAMRGSDRGTLFGVIEKRFARHGYKLPRLVFWNVNSRTNVIPIRENEQGVALVSGFSANVCRMVLSDELEPYAFLKKLLNSERYVKVEERVRIC